MKKIIILEHAGTQILQSYTDGKIYENGSDIYNNREVINYLAPSQSSLFNNKTTTTTTTISFGNYTPNPNPTKMQVLTITLQWRQIYGCYL